MSTTMGKIIFKRQRSVSTRYTERIAAKVPRIDSSYFPEYWVGLGLKGVLSWSLKVGGVGSGGEFEVCEVEVGVEVGLEREVGSLEVGSYRKYHFLIFIL